MVLSAEIIDVFLRVLQQLRGESNQRLEGLEEHAVDTVSKYLAGLSSVSVDLFCEGDLLSFIRCSPAQI